MTGGRRRSGETHDRATRRRGLFGEAVAAVYLVSKGYRILDRRYRTPVGEVDLIARRGGVTAFVEVKVRPALAGALEAVTYRQQRRVAAAAGYWLSEKMPDPECDFRFDIVAVCGRRLPHHVEGAFTADGF